MEFKTLQLSDRAWVEPILAAEGSRSAGYNFGTLYLWAPMWRQTIARFENRLIIRYDLKEKTYFCLPCGQRSSETGHRGHGRPRCGGGRSQSAPLQPHLPAKGGS